MVGPEELEHAMPSADADDLADRLATMSPSNIDQLAFGVIGFDDDERVQIYNTHESKISGIDPERVIGRHLFTEVAPCTNNYLVAERYRDHDELDESLDYVFTLRMHPTPVRIRLLARRDSDLRFMIVVRPSPA